MNRTHCLAVLLLLSGWAPSVRGAEAAPTKILLISTRPDHEWGTHMYRHECGLLAKCLNQTSGVEASVCPDFDWPADAAQLAGVKALVFYSRSAGDIVLNPVRRDAARKLLQDGVGFAAIHWATGTDNVELGPDYLEILGGWFHLDHCKLNTTKSRLTQLVPEHPVCRGWQPYELRDEFYLHLKFHPQAQAVLQVSVDGQAQVVGWVLERAKSNGGRSFGITLGHFHDNFGIEPFRKAIVNGILWTAHVDIPAEGAPVAVTATDLELPPKP